MLMGLPRFFSASGMFAEAHVDDFYAIIRKRTASLMHRIRGSDNSILKLIYDKPDHPILGHCRHVHNRALDNLLSEDELFNAVMPFISGDNLLRPRDGSMGLRTDKNNFQVNLDVHHFAPEEVSVKTSDGFVVVSGKHEEKRDDHGWVSRQFTRRYALPEGCNADAVQSRLSSDGVLTVVAPLLCKVNERTVPIIQTGPVRKDAQESAMK